MDSTLLLGRDFSEPGRAFIKTITGTPIAVGISVGKQNKPNQDAIAVSVSENVALLAVADGHWGHEASELGVRLAMEMLESPVRPPEGNEVRGRLYALFEQVNRRLFDTAMGSPGAVTPETTLIVCWLCQDLDGSQLYWASFGDSYLYLRAGDTIRQLNTLKSCWLGALSMMAERAGAQGLTLLYPTTGEDRYLGVAAGLETGMEKLEAGTSLLLCTDGLIEPAGREAALTSTDLRPILGSDQSPELRVRALLDTALARGGSDNIACVLAEIPYILQPEC